MRQRIFISIIFAGLFFVVLFFLLTRSNTATDLEKAFIIPPAQQHVNERNWNEIFFEIAGVSEEFISSSHMRFGEDDYIYVADNDKKVVKQFDINGNLINSFGNGEGRGPGEFLIIIDILLDQSGYLWVLDDRNSRITVFNTEDKDDWRLMDFSEMFNKVLPVGQDEYWLETRFDIQMKKYTLAGEYIGEVEPIVDDPPLWAFVLEGFYALAPNGDVVQSQYYTNNLVKYSRDGELIYFRKSVESPGLPEINPHFANDVGRFNTVDRSSSVQITDGPHVTNETIHLFVYQRDKEEWQPGFIDVYDLENGDYLFSYELPERVESVAISKNYLAGISEDLGKLVVWKMNST